MTDTLEIAGEDELEITDLASLGRAFREIGNAHSRIAEIEQTAKAERERIDAWLHDATESDRKRITFWEQLAARYALSRRSESGDKSLTTAWGRISTREQQPEYVRDEAVLQPWAERHGFIKEKVSRSVDWEAIKKAATRTVGGLLSYEDMPIPGVVVRDREPSVEVVPW